MRKYLIPAVGAAAFVIGGLIARAKTLDGIETLETRYFNKTPESSPEDYVKGEAVMDDVK